MIIIMDNDRTLTGYQLYNPEVKKRTKRRPIDQLYPEFSGKKYEIIYADPPWDYNGKLQFDKSSSAKEELDAEREIFISSASFKYPTLKKEELFRLRVDKIRAENCLLFMWATNPHLAQAIEVGQSWGFEYKTVAFVWDKMIHNPGKYTLSNCELCLVFKHGKIPQPRGARNIQQLVRSPRRAHSMKPDEVRHHIEAMFPTQAKIELFARGRFNKWDEWGLDVQKPTEEFFSLIVD